jgi:acetylornithine/succinyldiaminopimelate/putrescine aminotransferase
VSERCAGWLTEDGFAHMSSFGGAELGCVVALKTLEICTRPETRESVANLTTLFGRGLERIRDDNPGWFTGIRQNGLVIGLEFGHPEGAKQVMRDLYERGVWAIFSTLDPSVLQYKPGILLDTALAGELLEHTAEAIRRAGREVEAR